MVYRRFFLRESSLIGTELSKQLGWVGVPPSLRRRIF